MYQRLILGAAMGVALLGSNFSAIAYNDLPSDCHGALMSMPPAERAHCMSEVRNGINPRRLLQPAGPIEKQACYKDKSPGGCAEFVQTMSLGIGDPANIPRFCAIGPDPNSGGATPGPLQDLTREQYKACIDAVHAEDARLKKEGAAAEREAVMLAQWKTVVADNGSAMKIDLHSVQHGLRGDALAIVISYPAGLNAPGSKTQLHFDCRGGVSDFADSFRYTIPVPPRSVLGAVAALACTPPKLPPPNPADYCKGFSAEACRRMEAVGLSGQNPSYCKEGFALVGSGLSGEQARTCHVVRAYAQYRSRLANSP